MRLLVVGPQGFGVARAPVRAQGFRFSAGLAFRKYIGLGTWASCVTRAFFVLARPRFRSPDWYPSTQPPALKWK